MNSFYSRHRELLNSVGAVAGITTAAFAWGSIGSKAPESSKSIVVRHAAEYIGGKALAASREDGLKLKKDENGEYMLDLTTTAGRVLVQIESRGGGPDAHDVSDVYVSKGDCSGGYAACEAVELIKGKDGWAAFEGAGKLQADVIDEARYMASFSKSITRDVLAAE